MAVNVNVNYDDERFSQVEEAKKEALTRQEQTYGSMINNSDSFYQAQIDASKQWADTQQQLQQQQTDFAIEQIGQQQAQADKDYLKEQSGAYKDWRKQSNEYGTEAEKMASAGLAGTGFSESSQVSMYNTYQNRLASAREAKAKADMNFANAIKDARLQNNAALAEIAYKAYQQQLSLALEGFQYKNQLIMEQENRKLELENIYYSRWQDVLAQINQENTMAEQIRQYEQNYALQMQQFQEQIRQFNEEIQRLKKNDELSHQLEIQNLELKKAQLEEEKRQFDQTMAARRASYSSGTSSANYITEDNTKQTVVTGAVMSAVSSVTNNALDGINKSISGIYSGWTNSQWTEYFQKFKATYGTQSAEKEYESLVRSGAIPRNQQMYAAMGIKQN